VPVAALVPKFGGAIAPLGPSLVIGAFVFGIGMQLANGCGSGTLYTVGGGSGRMLIALLFFVIGSVFGSLSLPSFLALGGIGDHSSATLPALGRTGKPPGRASPRRDQAVIIARRRGATVRRRRGRVRRDPSGCSASRCSPPGTIPGA
jgi:hypothetical protein